MLATYMESMSPIHGRPENKVNKFIAHYTITAHPHLFAVVIVIRLGFGVGCMDKVKNGLSIL